MTVGEAVALLAMGLVAVLSGVVCWYFSHRYEPRSAGVVALVLLTGFIFFVDLLLGSIFYVATVARLEMTFEGMVKGLIVPVLGVACLGLLGTGLTFLLVVRREVGGER